MLFFFFFPARKASPAFSRLMIIPVNLPVTYVSGAPAGGQHCTDTRKPKTQHLSLRIAMGKPSEREEIRKERRVEQDTRRRRGVTQAAAEVERARWEESGVIVEKMRGRDAAREERRHLESAVGQLMERKSTWEQETERSQNQAERAKCAKSAATSPALLEIKVTFHSYLWHF